MGRQISLFSSFKKEENNITNYCGLMLRLIYEDNPKVFEEIINDLIEEDRVEVDPSFQQQTKEKDNIPDLTITQNSFEIMIETKIGDWHDARQTMKQLEALKENKKDIKICFLLSNEFRNDDIEHRFPDEYKFAEENNIYLTNITFEEIVTKIEEKFDRLSKTIQEFTKEFREFLEGANWLETWVKRLDIINCARSIDVVKNKIYVCPNMNGAYNHARAKFFGAYANKAVNYIAKIKAIVVLTKDDDNEIRYNNSNQDEKELIAEAKQKIADNGISIHETGSQVFLLEDMREDINLYKSSKGAIKWSKMYIDLGNISEMNALVEKLRNQPWERKDDIQKLFD